MSEIIGRELWYNKLLFYCLRVKEQSSILDITRMKIEDLLRKIRGMTMQSVIWAARRYSTPLIEYHQRRYRKDAFVQSYMQKILVWAGSVSSKHDENVEAFKKITLQAAEYRVDWNKEQSEALCAKLIKDQKPWQDAQIFAECDAHIRWCIKSYNEDTNSFINKDQFKEHLMNFISNGCYEDKYVYQCLQQESNQKYINEIRSKYKTQFQEELPSMKSISTSIFNVLDKHFDLNTEFINKQIEEEREKLKRMYRERGQKKRDESRKERESRPYEEIWKYESFEKRHEPFVVVYLKLLEQWIKEAQRKRPNAQNVKDKVDAMKSLMLEANKYASWKWNKGDCESPDKIEDKQHNIKCNNAMRDARIGFELWMEKGKSSSLLIALQILGKENCWWDQAVYDCFIKSEHPQDPSKVTFIQISMSQMEQQLIKYKFFKVFKNKPKKRKS